jgi:uncharacterized protein YndB with AHSA1/START domain
MTVEASINVNAPAEAVYNLVADLPSMGKWSPECVRCDWLGGATAAAPGARFKGRNRQGWHRWSTTGTVVAAEPGRQLSWDITSIFGLPVARWTYSIEPAGDGCRVVERMDDHRGAFMKFAARAATGVKDRTEHNKAGMQETLERLKAAAEAS